MQDGWLVDQRAPWWRCWIIREGDWCDRIGQARAVFQTLRSLTGYARCVSCRAGQPSWSQSRS